MQAGIGIGVGIGIGTGPKTTKPTHGAWAFFATSVSGELVLDERLEALAARRVAQLAQRLRLDLADALARHLEVLTDLLEGMVGLLADAEPHAEHLLLARRERREHLAGLIREVDGDDALARRDDRLVLDEVAEVR